MSAINIKLNTNKRKAYQCIVEELDRIQISNLKAHIQDSKNLEPWFLTFVRRFHLLANKRELSKAKISKECNDAKYQIPQLKPRKDSLSAGTLSAVTCHESANIRLPNANTLIVLAKYFGVSIDYLVGLSNCTNPQYDDINKATGLSDSAITSLKLNCHLLNMPKYSYFPNGTLPLNISGELDIEKLPNITSTDLATKYYVEDREVSYEEIIAKHNTIVNTFSEMLPPEYAIDQEHDSPEIINQKLTLLKNLTPHEHFIDTLNILLTYKNGAMINLISEYLFHNKKDSTYTLQNDSTKVPSLYQPIDTDELSKEAFLLSKIQTELVKMHNRVGGKII